MSVNTKPSVVFAHGLWADGSCFQKLIPTLQADGHEVICSQHGLDPLKSDVQCVTRCFGRVSGPVVLVGHSYGGTLITHAGMDDRVAALVYIAALAPDEAETSQSLQQKFPVTDVFSHIEVADGRIWLLRDGVAAFAGDLPEAEQKVVWATQAVPVPDLFTQKAEGVAWRSKPSWYIVAKNDRTVHPDLERFVAKRMGATTAEVRQQPRSHALQPRPRTRCDPQGRRRCPKSLSVVNLHFRVCIPMKSRTSARRRVASWSSKEREA
jgi:pimeloyl-ACP methyl ester carboxylesterase